MLNAVARLPGRSGCTKVSTWSAASTGGHRQHSPPVHCPSTRAHTAQLSSSRRSHALSAKFVTKADSSSTNGNGTTPEGSSDEEQVKRDKVLVKRLDVSQNLPQAAAFFLGWAALTAGLGYVLHPYLVETAIGFFGISQDGGPLSFMKRDITVFETSFFGFLSFLFATMIGSTFGMLYTRQTQIVQELYKEVLALEYLLVECLQQVKTAPARMLVVSLLTKYVNDEIGNASEITSPFRANSAISKLLRSTGKWQAEGVHTQGIVSLCKDLIAAQSSRSAMSVHILSPVHWIMMWTIGFFFVGNFIIFETGSPSSSVVSGEHRMIFSVLVGLSTSVMLVLHDLSDAETGTYSYRAALDERLDFIREELSSWEVSAEPPVPISLEKV